MKRRPLMYSLGAAILCTFTLIEYLNFTGFCYAQRRYFGEQELVDFAIKREIYGSVEDFHKVNPNCCILYRWGHPDLAEGIWVRSFGWYISVAEIWYRLSTKSPSKFFRAHV